MSRRDGPPAKEDSSHVKSWCHAARATAVADGGGVVASHLSLHTIRSVL